MKSQGSREYKDVVIRKVDPRGKEYYWIGGRPRWKKRAGSDFSAVHQGLVSITPMHMEFTDLQVLDDFNRRGIKL